MVTVLSAGRVWRCKVEGFGMSGVINVGALVVRIGFWGILITIVGEYTPKPYSNY